jgi:hypothetical protein
MLNHIFLKFALFFIGGVIVAVGITQVLPSVLTNKQHTSYYSESASPVLGADSELGNQITQQATNKLQTATQSIVQQMLYSLTQNPAFAPINETTRDVQNAASGVQSLPQEQRKAICREVCGDF